MTATWAAFENDQEGIHILRGDVIVCEHVNSMEEANLIIAAPELLEALKGLFECCSPEIPGTPDSVLEKARAAIAKAEGRA